jgi:type I restriction enzyme R subunit
VNEAETRAEYIDPALRAAGWGVVGGTRILREYRITEGRLQGSGKRSRRDIADYILVYRNHKLATLEAKRWDLHYSEGMAQAKEYAQKVACRFAYASNGQKIYGADLESGTEGDVECYPFPDELWNRTFGEQNEWRDRFSAVPFEDGGGTWGARYYQDIAINNVLEAVAAGKQRILLTLATGTGKTMIAFQIAWKLFQSRWTLSGDQQRRPRILFLADRNILANQAFNDFSAFAEDALVRISPDDIRKRGKVPKNGNVFFTIFQTFITGASNEGRSTPYFGDYPPTFFDFIVIDECHRGGANDESNWRDIMEYFSAAVQLGLTATPKRNDNVDTYKYFGEPVYTYSLKEGINDGFLTPFKVKQISATLDEYVYTSDDTLVEGEIEAGKRYAESDFNRIIEIEEREVYRTKQFMDLIDQREKTLVFCATQDHALAVRNIINQSKSSTNANYCVRVTANDGALGERYLREFQDNEKTIPTILTTSEKLSTGVNARNVRNIVLMRPINSIIEFKQIIGRGTRLYDGKDYFTIYDFVKAHEHFQDPAWDGEPIDETVPPKPSVGDPPIGGPPFSSLPGIPPEKERKQKIKIRLADGKERQIQSMVATTFWSTDGKPMSAQQFLESLFGTIPELFKSETELRDIWSDPSTRKALIEALAEKGFGKDQLTAMQNIIDADKSDLFDVLAYIAFASPTETREARVAHAQAKIFADCSDKQKAFLDFVLSQYVSQGVGELDSEKLVPLLNLKYNNAISDALADLGDAASVRRLFMGFQKHLYQPWKSFSDVRGAVYE